MKTTAAKDRAHRRLFNAVISFTGAEQHGSRVEVRAAAIELEAATRESQKLLYPEEPKS
jgi:arginyl-tRNA synthetase